ncbi:MAG TPA: hypothetical protein VEZ24_02260 [Microvirga sp.]|nr:hypothetical protein [Microvirga sp.]
MITMLAAASLLAMGVLGTASAANRHVDIVNDTGRTMEEFYASATNTDDWEEDILGKDTLAHGEVFDVDIDDGSGACKFDFKAVFTDGTSHVMRAVDVCTISRFTYHR